MIGGQKVRIWPKKWWAYSRHLLNLIKKTLGSTRFHLSLSLSTSLEWTSRIRFNAKSSLSVTPTPITSMTILWGGTGCQVHSLPSRDLLGLLNLDNGDVGGEPIFRHVGQAEVATCLSMISHASLNISIYNFHVS